MFHELNIVADNKEPIINVTPNNPSSLIDIVKKMVDSKLTISQKNRNCLTSSELAGFLNCTPRTLFAWRKLREQGNKSKGIACIKIKGQYQYPIEAIYQYYLKDAIF